MVLVVISLGVDPDLHTTGIALVEDDRPIYTAVARVPTTITGEDAVLHMIEEFRTLCPSQWVAIDQRRPKIAVVEGQQIYLKGKANKDSILRLAQVAGGMAGILAAEGIPVRIPRPQEWKGSVEKAIMQKRILNKAKMEYMKSGKYLFPSKPQGLSHQDWFHVTDALGLGQWGARKAG